MPRMNRIPTRCHRSCAQQLRIKNLELRVSPESRATATRSDNSSHMRRQNGIAVLKVSLNRALSKLGILSRAQATRAIRAGRVRVDGRIVVDPAHPVVPERA